MKSAMRKKKELISAVTSSLLPSNSRNYLKNNNASTHGPKRQQLDIFNLGEIKMMQNLPVINNVRMPLPELDR